MTSILARDVLDLLKPAGTHTVAAIAETLGASVSDTESALATLVRSGCVVSDGDGWDVVPILRRGRE